MFVTSDSACCYEWKESSVIATFPKAVAEQTSKLFQGQEKERELSHASAAPQIRLPAV